MNQSEPADVPEVHLQDVTEDETLEIAPPASSRKKKLLMMGALIVLLLLTAVGGYFLLSGKEVNVRATRKTPERVTNGSDLQQAAYDSLRGSLSSSPSAVGQNGGANIGTNQPTTIAMAGMTPSPVVSPSPSPKATAPIQSGIAMTIAPPPEVTANTTPVKPVGTPSPLNTFPTDNQATPQNSNSIAVSKPKTDASIVFANLPVPRTEKNESPTTAYHDGPQPFPLPRPALSGEKSLRALPSFGVMLPVRLLGMLYTLRPNSFVRLELLRESKTEHWQLPRGTIFVGAVQGAGRDRAYVQIKGFLDPTTERFTKLDGEALGSDGGAGLRGKERRLSSVWLRVLDRAAQTGTQLLSSLLGRNGSQVIIAADPAGMYRSTMNNESSLQNNRSFVEVAAGTVGFVLVTTLPTAAPTDATITTNQSAASESLTDAELADLFSSSDPAKIRAALPRLTPEVRRVVEQSLQAKEH